MKTEKFYTTNKDVFQRYFDHPTLSNSGYYDQLLAGKNVEKIKEIINQGREFDLDKTLAGIFEKLNKQIKIWKC